MTRSVLLRLLSLACLVGTLTACPTGSTHNPTVPTGGLSAAEQAALQAQLNAAQTPLPSGASPFVRPALIEASHPDPSPSAATPSPSPTPSATPAPSATAPVPSGSPTRTPTPKPSGIGLLGPNVGPSPVEDPTARYFASPGT